MPNFGLLATEFLIAGLGLGVLIADFSIPWRSRRFQNLMLALVSSSGLILIGIYSILARGSKPEFLYDQLIFIDNFSLIFKVFAMGVGAAVILTSIDYVYRKIRSPGEFYALIVLAVLGADLVASSGEMLTAYISVEVLAFSLYVLVAISRGDGRSAEAAVKYILLGALSSALMLFGVALLYGALGETTFRYMESIMFALLGHQGTDTSMTVILGLAMFFGGLGFKLSLVPFHLWAPDVYEGAPTPVTALIAVLSKAAVLGLLIRFLAEAGYKTADEWQLPLAILAAATMTIGTFTALVQQNIKRLFAYSSIAQVGFVLVGLISLNENGINAVILHLYGYAFTNLAAFAVIISMETRFGEQKIESFNGLATRSPFLAMVMASALFSLAGLPIFAGFITKFLLFTAAVEAGLTWLMVIAVINSLISLYYYIRIIRHMYVEKPDSEESVSLSVLASVPIWLLFLGMILIGIYPQPLMDVANSATMVLGPFAS
tara:strand:- start:47 stop:1516 length:1470 start_codon:yes stop_codon:yes gene_type:complete